MADDEEPCQKRSRRSKPFYRLSARAPINIAVVKYWGKRDEKLILPINSSLSATLNWQELCTTTTVVANEDFPRDSLWINEREQPIADSPRIQNCLTLIRDKCRKEEPERWEQLKDCHLYIASKNNFPTAAGLASSASGHACLVFLLAKLFHLDCELSEIARQGSGSACRSMYGGFVAWLKGENKDGHDSIAKQIKSEEHWQSLRVLILVVNDKEKSTPSTVGMKRSVETSELLMLRAEHCVNQRMKDMEQAILDKDFETFAELTMKESNQLHAVCQDTYPPIEPPYMNNTSHYIVQLVTAYNQFNNTNKVAYTFDAGPNAVLFLHEKDVSSFVSLIQFVFPPEDPHSFIKGIPISAIPDLSNDLIHSIKIDPLPSTIKYIISTKVGSGPSLIQDDNIHLLTEDGSPIG